MTEHKLSTEPYKGVRDFYPADWDRMTFIFNSVRNLLRLYGYEEYQASPLERSELYESKGNEEIVNEQTYTFEDRGGRMVTLRPEMTPTLARMVAGKRRELAMPLRWFSIGNRFRYERPQKGREREFYQCDIDFVGLPAGEADLEIVGLAHRILTAFRATEDMFKIKVNDRNLLMRATVVAGCDSVEKSRQYLRLLDKKDKITPEEYAAQLKALGLRDPLGVIKESDDAEIVAGRTAVQEFVNELIKRGVGNAVFDPTLARGFDYYTGVVFEIFDTNPANPRALFGGGRYDGLVSLFGGDPIPAVGFAFGDVTFTDFLEAHEILPTIRQSPLVYIGCADEQAIPFAQKAAAELRKFGISTWVNLKKKKLFDQLDEAKERKIPFFIYSDDDARIKSEVRVQPLFPQFGDKDAEPWAQRYALHDAAHLIASALQQGQQKPPAA